MWYYISFQTGYRELTGLLEYVQFNGRINRNCEFKIVAHVGESQRKLHNGRIDRECQHRGKSNSYIFDFSSDIKNNQDGILTEHPSIKKKIKVFKQLTEKQITPKHCIAAVEMELNSVEEKIDYIDLEKRGWFKEIAENYRVINSMTTVILTSDEVVDKMKHNQYVSPVEISKCSVQVWANRLEKLLESKYVYPLKPVIEDIVIQTGENRYFDTEYYVWKNKECLYDSEFFGIGKGILKL